MHTHSRSAFTLIEISIVLVIIGLIVGGILVGRDLITASEIRKDISNFEKYNAAANTFKLKYNALPGDLLGADKMLTLVGYVDACYSIVKGDGKIGLLNGMWTACESVGFFDMLNAAGLGEFKPSGYDSMGNNQDAAPGYAIPALISSPSSGWAPYTSWRSGPSPVGIPLETIGDFKNWYYIGYGNNIGGDGSFSRNGGITATLAYTIDTKIDDGNPMKGKVLNACTNWYDAFIDYTGDLGMDCLNVGKGACTKSSDGMYNLANKERSCGLNIRADF